MEMEVYIPFGDSKAQNCLSKCVGKGEYQIRSSDFRQHAQKYCQETSQRGIRDVPDTLLPLIQTLKHIGTNKV